MNVIDGELFLENITVPLGLSKKHLLLIASLTNGNVFQQDHFIKRVIRERLNVNELKGQLSLGLNLKNENDLLVVYDLLIKKTYDLRSLGIKASWGEVQINQHIVKNISKFIKVVLGTNWGFLPDQHVYIGGRKKNLDLVFYNVFTHNYLIIDLKCCSLASSMDRGKSQMISYVKAYNQGLNLSFQKKTIGLILCKEPIDRVYFDSTGTVESIFYSGFQI